MPMYLLLAIGAALAYTVGGVCMKLSGGMTRLGPTLLVYLLFATGATLQTAGMRRSSLGVAYLLVLGLESLLAFGFGLWLFRESHSVPKLLGVAAIVVGILLLHVGEN
jgi:multidrug transporter EmrE-like cation transporter